jgi:hypothetical protein
MTRWFVPPIVIPFVLAVVLVAYGLFQTVS